jgi:hypothetical protein
MSDVRRSNLVWVYRGKSRSACLTAVALVPTSFCVERVHGQARVLIRRVVSFGDSLLDAGTYWLRLTANLGLTFVPHLALHCEQLLPPPNRHLDRCADPFKGYHGSPVPYGLKYPEGGARVSKGYSTVSQDPEGMPKSAARQLKHYLAQHHGFSRGASERRRR